MDQYMLAQVIAQTPAPSWTLRKGFVVSVDGATVTVTIGGSDVQVSGIKYLGSAPSASAGCWLMVSETDLFVLGQT